MRKGKEPEPDPDPYLCLTDPDAGGPKTNGSGSGTALNIRPKTWVSDPNSLIPDPGSWWFRNQIQGLDDQIQIFYLWKKLKDFFDKNAMFLFLGPHEELSSDRRSLEGPKENIQTWNFFTFFFLLRLLLPSWIRIQFPEPDPEKTWLNQDSFRIRNTCTSKKYEQISVN